MRKDKKRFVWRSTQVFVSSFFTVAVIGALVFFTKDRAIPVLDPKGTIADQQYILILITVALGFLVVVPVFILLFSIAWKYRAGNKKAKYDPELEGSKLLEVLWWGIPIIIIVALAVITFISTHALDPYKPLESDKKPISVQVITLQSNWLFIYPEQQAATLNYMNIPVDTPINLSLTSDAPMNAFWVPALAGQVYTMNGMATKLHFMADSEGTFRGATTNINGEAYADMTFNVYAMNESSFASWVNTTTSKASLNAALYESLVKERPLKAEKTYTLATKSLFDDVIMKYMDHGGSTHAMEGAQ